MFTHARENFIELSYVYGGAIILVLFLSFVASPIAPLGVGLVVSKKENKAQAVYTPDSFKDITVKAKAYIVYDLVDKKIVASKNADVPLPLASVTKIMTGVTALTHYDENTRVVIKPDSIEDGYDLGLSKDQTWKLKELLKYTLVFSSNDGAHAIADTLGGRKKFVAQMNTDSALLGFSMTFTDPAGLDIGDNIGGIGTALDVAKLFGVARKLYPSILEATTRTRVSVTANTKDRVTGIPNTNQDIANFFGAEASKTGFTDIAGGNLGVVVDVALGHPVVIVVLGSTRDERFTDTEILYKALLKSLQ